MVVSKVFFGTHNTYMELAARGAEVLGFSLQYYTDPDSGIGLMVGRFVLHAPKNAFGTFKFLVPRDLGQFHYELDQPFQGLRFQRWGIPVFMPGPPLAALLQHCDKFQIWNMLADWIAELCKEEGFSLLLPGSGALPVELRSLVAGEHAVTDENLQLVFSLPNLKEGKNDGD